MEQKTRQLNFWFFIIAFWAVILIHGFLDAKNMTESITYSQLQEYLEQGKVKELLVDNQFMMGEYKKPINGKSRFITPRLEPELAQQLSRYDVEYTAAPEHTFLSTLLSWIAPAFFFFLIWYLFFRRFAEKQGMGNYLSIGKSKAKVYVEQDTKVTMDDVAGVDEAKAEVREIVDFLKNPKDYTKLGAKMPKGVLLVGPPGSGKTLLAKAIAGEAKVPFFSISGAEFVEMFVGVGAARVRDLFQQAREKAPAIIFIDELDALGRSRGASHLIGGHDEREQTLNQLLTEMDGFDPAEGIILLAATNRPEILDPALLRAGRFDRQVLVDRPDKPGRLQILKVHTRKVKLGNVDLEKVAAMTTGFSGADLATLVNEAAIMATRRKKDTIDLDDFTQAFERMVAGLEKKNRVLNPEERKRVAYHEMGHALVALALPDTDPVHKISIIPRGIGSLGHTMQRPTEDRFLMTREELLNRIKVLLGGRAAEKLVFDEISTGASDDLAKATEIARSMVTTYGMDEELGYIVYEKHQPRFLGPSDDEPLFAKKYSEATAQQIDAAVRKMMDEAFDKSLQILQDNRNILEESARLLLEKETLEEEALKTLTRNLKRLADNQNVVRV